MKNNSELNKYDTRRLRELIKKKYSKPSEFVTILAQKTGLTKAHIRKGINGTNVPNAAVKAEYKALLGLTEEEINRIWSAENRHVVKKKINHQEKTAREYTINREVLASAMEKAGLSVYKLSKILGVAPNAPYNWLDGKNVPQKETRNRLTALLGLKEEELLLPKMEQDVYEPSSDTSVDTSSDTPKGSNDLFKSIEGEKDIFKLFNIINENILTLAREMDKCMRLQENRFNSLSDEIKSVREAVLSGKKEEEEKPVTVIARPKAIYKKKEESYATDTFDYYKHQINEDIKKINNRTPGSTFSQILSNFYDRLKNEYGAVRYQLEKDYVAAKGHKASSTMEYIWFNQIFRDIFANIVKDEANKS